MVNRVVAYRQVVVIVMYLKNYLVFIHPIFFDNSGTHCKDCGKLDTQMTCTHIIKPQITIVGSNELNGINCSYGDLYLLEIKK